MRFPRRNTPKSRRSRDRQQPLPFGHRQNLGLLHHKNLIQSSETSETIIFSGQAEFDRKVMPKDSAGSSGNQRKCEFPYLLLWVCLLFNGFRPLIPQQATFWTRPAKTGYDPKEK
jgi:hypothetical protein